MYKTLIVEDDPMVAMINRQYVEATPQFEVVGTCKDGQEALDYLAQNDVDLIVLDVYMPKRSGLEVLEELGKQKSQASVVMVTAANEIDAVRKALQHGVVDYLVKPFTQERFNEAIAKVAAYRASLQSHGSVDQSAIDRFLRGSRASAPKEAPSAASGVAGAPKGVQSKTAEILIEALRQNGKTWKNGDDIAAVVKLSSVTVRRYMNHLVQADLAESKMDYTTGGRPRLLYRCK